MVLSVARRGIDVRRAASFRVALREFTRETEQAARKSGLTPQRYLLLLLIKGAEDGSERATISELGKRLQLAQSTVTELVNRAAQAGLVTRGTSPDDGRVVYVQLTEEGDRRFAQAFRALAHERRALHEVVTNLEA
jgi:DNA-binding MarR family transcriptional regulator